MSRTTNFDVPNGASFLAIPFNVVRWDNGAPTPFFAGGNPTRLTAPVDGIYQVSSQLLVDTLAGPALATVEHTLLVNGVLTPWALNTPAPSDPASPTSGSSNNIHTQIRLLAGQYVEVTVSQISGVTLTIGAVPNVTPEFTMTRVGPYPGP